MKRYLFLLIVVFAFLLPACSVLSDSQITNINVFATTASHYNNYPSAIFKKRAGLHLEYQLLASIQLTDSSLLDMEVNRAKANYDMMMALSAKFDLSIQLIQQYAGLLVELSSDKYTKGMNNSSVGLGANLDGLVSAYNGVSKDTLPAGIGGELSNVVWALGRRVTQTKQAVALKQFIPRGNILITSAVNSLVEVLDSLKLLVAHDKEAGIVTFHKVVFNGRSNSNGNSYTFVQQYYHWLVDFDNLEALRQKCIVTALQLVKAHQALVKIITEKKDLPGLIKETQDLVTDFQDLGKIAGNWTSDIHINL
jgi:hypothetical protein